MTKPLPSEQPNIIEDYDENIPTSCQQNFHMSPSYPHIIIPEVPVPPPRVHPNQPTRVEMEGPIPNLISIGKKTPIPKFVLTAQYQKVREANAVTHKISVVAHEYRHLVNVPDR